MASRSIRRTVVVVATGLVWSASPFGDGSVVLATPEHDAAMTSPLQVYEVNSAADPGVSGCDATECTLREAIWAANGDETTSSIVFVERLAAIRPLSALPAITEPVTIDGTRTGGAGFAPGVQLSGAFVPLAAGLSITGPSSVVKGLVIDGFGTGIRLSGPGARRNTIEGNQVGGSLVGAGIHLQGAGANEITGNVISGNHTDGIRLFGGEATANVIRGNLIGTDASGEEAVGNAGAGVRIENAPSNTVGGFSPSDRNVISANAHGVWITEPAATGNRVLGNHIGTNAAGTKSLGNPRSGVFISNAPSNTVGGDELGSSNLIAGNRHGVEISGREATGNVVQGNHIGGDALGTEPLGNTESGIWIASATSNLVGGATANARNVITGNRDGVVVSGEVTGNLVQGNRIEANREAGVIVFERSTLALLANVIHGNGGLGIDRGLRGVTEPGVELREVRSGGPGAMQVVGTLAAASASKRSVELFASPGCDGSGYGEGNRYLGSVSVPAGAVTFEASLPVADGVLTATVTGQDLGDTSEFSRCVVVPPVLSIHDVTSAEGDEGETAFSFHLTLSRSSDAPVAVRFETAPGTADEADFRQVAGTVLLPAGQTSAIVAVPVIGDTRSEHDETFTVVLTDPSGALVPDDQGLGTIVDDDPAAPSCRPQRRRACR